MSPAAKMTPQPTSSMKSQAACANRIQECLTQDDMTSAAADKLGADTAPSKNLTVSVKRSGSREVYPLLDHDHKKAESSRDAGNHLLSNACDDQKSVEPVEERGELALMSEFVLEQIGTKEGNVCISYRCKENEYQQEDGDSRDLKSEFSTTPNPKDIDLSIRTVEPSTATVRLGLVGRGKHRPSSLVAPVDLNRSTKRFMPSASSVLLSPSTLIRNRDANTSPFSAAGWIGRDEEHDSVMKVAESDKDNLAERNISEPERQSSESGSLGGLLLAAGRSVVRLATAVMPPTREGAAATSSFIKGTFQDTTEPIRLEDHEEGSEVETEANRWGETKSTLVRERRNGNAHTLGNVNKRRIEAPAFTVERVRPVARKRTSTVSSLFGFTVS